MATGASIPDHAPPDAKVLTEGGCNDVLLRQHAVVNLAYDCRITHPLYLPSVSAVRSGLAFHALSRRTWPPHHPNL